MEGTLKSGRKVTGGYKQLRILCVLLLLSACNQRQLSLEEADAMMKTQVGFDPTATGFVFRYRYFPGRESTLFGIGAASSAQAGRGEIPELPNLSVVPPGKRSETIKRLEFACQALGNSDQASILADPATKFAKGASMKEDAFVDIAVNLEKRWFVVSVLRN